jgi:hypothetical protein
MAPTASISGRCERFVRIFGTGYGGHKMTALLVAAGTATSERPPNRSLALNPCHIQPFDR